MDMINRIRNRFFLASLIVGGAAGFCQGFTRQSAWISKSEVAANVFTGVVLVAVACFIGGFVGLLAKNVVRAMRGLKPDHEYDMSYAIIICAFFGAAIGTLIGYVAGSPNALVPGAAVGSFVGGMLGAIPGEHFPIILQLLVEDERY